MATPHIEAQPGDFADTVLMPGDPLRAQYIAETFLDDVVKVNGVRNMLGFTGRYRGRRISVMGSGMGIPSLSIYAKELITEYGVDRLVRVGSCGAVRDDVAVNDIVVGMGACTDSGVNRARFNGHDFAAIADFELTRHAVDTARERGTKVLVGNLFSADLFYTPDIEFFQTMKRHGILGVEMEAAGLYGVAAEFGARALTICTVSDHILKGEALDAQVRQTGFAEMMAITLEGLLKDDQARQAS